MERRKREYKSLGGATSRLQRMRDSSASIRRQAADATLQQRRRLRLEATPLDREQQQQQQQQPQEDQHFNSAVDVAAAIDAAVHALEQAVQAAERPSLDQHCLDQIRDLRRLVTSSDDAIAHEACRHLASHPDGRYKEASSRVLKECLQGPSSETKGEALWIATNVTGILPLSVSAPFAHDLIPLAVSALDPASNDHAIIKQAAWLIANVAAVLDDDGIDGESATAAQQLRQMVVGDQVLRSLTSVALSLNPPWPPDVRSIVAWSLSNILRASPGDSGVVQRLEALCGGPHALSTAFTQFWQSLNLQAGVPMNHDTTSVMQELLWVCCFLSASCSQEMSQAMVQTEWLAFITHLLKLPGLDPSLQVPSVRSLGNILGATGEHGVMLFISDPIQGLDCLSTLLRHPDPSSGPPPPLLLRKDTLWVLSHVACHKTTAHALLGDTVVQALTETMANSPFHIRQEGAWTLMTACLHASPQGMREFVGRPEILDLIHSIMSRQSAAADEELSFVFLSFEEKTLALGKDLVVAIEASSGIEALENVSTSTQLPVDISEFASQLIDTYYGEDYGDDDDDNANGAPIFTAATDSYPSWRLKPQ